MKNAGSVDEFFVVLSKLSVSPGISILVLVELDQFEQKVLRDYSSKLF